MSILPCPLVFQQWKNLSPNSILPSQKTLSFLSINPSFKAAIATIILKVEPGAYNPWIDLLVKGDKELFSREFQ